MVGFMYSERTCKPEYGRVSMTELFITTYCESEYGRVYYNDSQTSNYKPDQTRLRLLYGRVYYYNESYTTITKHTT